jgi:hypothetical protein
MPVVGAEAIKPRLGVAAGQPAFTTEDVIAYLADYPLQFRAQGKAEPVIESIEFMTVRDLNARYGGYWLQDDLLICLVTLRGQFRASVDPESPAHTGEIEYLVFDARTGNLLVEAIP